MLKTMKTYQVMRTEGVLQLMLNAFNLVELLRQVKVLGDDQGLLRETREDMGLDQVNEMLQSAIQEVSKRVGGGEEAVSTVRVAGEGDRTFINSEEIKLVKGSVQQVQGEYELVVNEKKQRMKR